MARPPHLAVAVAAIAAIVIPLRSLHAFDALNAAFDLMTLGYVSRLAWSLTAVVGFAALGFAYATRSDEGARRTLAVAVLAALVGVLAGNLLLVLATDVLWMDAFVANLLLVGAYSVLDAVTFAMLTLGGYALASDAPHRTA